MPTKKTTPKKKDMQQTNNSQIKIKKLELESQKLQHELKEKNDKLLRTCADIQNYQKRTEKELLFREEETKKKYLSELIELYELLDKAYEDENPKQGLKLILQNLEGFLEKEQIKHIDCVGKSFDHTMHHAITTIEKNDYEDNTIVEEVKKGYIIKEKVFRPSQVIVVKNKEDKKAVE
jgi:molecular chaperone GrpE